MNVGGVPLPFVLAEVFRFVGFLLLVELFLAVPLAFRFPVTRFGAPFVLVRVADFGIVYNFTCGMRYQI